MQNKKIKIYLAGPDVFCSNAKEIGAKLKIKCEEKGAEGLFPLNNEVFDPYKIVQGNMEMIRKADVVLANCNDFRGKDMDSGTAFEIGYAIALGKKVICYCLDLRSQIEKYGEKNGPYITEDFGSPLNIMIADTCDIYSSFDEALEAAVCPQL